MKWQSRSRVTRPAVCVRLQCRWALAHSTVMQMSVRSLNLQESFPSLSIRGRARKSQPFKQGRNSERILFGMITSSETVIQFMLAAKFKLVPPPPRSTCQASPASAMHPHPLSEISPIDGSTSVCNRGCRKAERCQISGGSL